MSEENVSGRFKEELRRIGVSFARAGELCGVSKNTAVSWGQGAKIPAEALAALMREGLDVFYVLGGREKDAPQSVMLNPDEVHLVDTWRGLSAESRTRMRGYLDALLSRDVDTGTSPRVRKRDPK